MALGGLFDVTWARVELGYAFDEIVNEDVGSSFDIRMRRGPLLARSHPG